MEKFKKILPLFLAVILLVGLTCVMTGCGENAADEGTGEVVSYTVHVESAGGMPLSGVNVCVYADDTLGDLKAFGETDANGDVSMQLSQSEKYALTLTSLPKGYAAESSYSFDGTNANVVLTSAPIADGSLSEVSLNLGDIMYDFTVTTPDGTQITLSEMLKEKEMVLLNFWYTGCSWCVTEFPFMEQAYQLYQEDVGIIAVDPLGESNEAIAAFPASQGLSLTFPLASCPTGWANTFSVTGYPTSVIIDRYGMIVMIERGAITSLRPFTSLFETLTGDDYEQKIYSSIADVVIIPEPTYEMADSETVACILGTSELDITFRPEEGESSKYTWPFIETEKNGEKCLKASNQLIEDSYAIIYADVTLKAGQALGFDFLRSTETNADFLYVIVDGEDINSISGFFNEERWESCYPLVAPADGTYEVALCYLKDAETDVGDDTVYIKNMRIVEESQIDTETYLPKQAAIDIDGFEYSYVDVVYNENDGYYHANSKDGPLLLVDLMNTTQLNEEDSIWNMAYNGDIKVGGVDYGAQIEQYANYAINSNLYGIVSINQELYELLQYVDQAVGFDEEDDKEWLKACKYFQAYGTDGQLEDPIKGLATFSAYTAKEGKNISTNKLSFNRLIMPRGLFAEFVPNRSGVYRITSRSDFQFGVDGWIFDENRNELLYYEDFYERTFTEEGEVSIVYYMEAGKPYYINMAPNINGEQVGDIYFDVEYVGRSYQQFICASPGAYTFSTDASGTAMNYTIAPGIDVILGDDGYYYHDLGNGKKGSKIYADFVNTTFAFPKGSISTVGDEKGLIDLGRFDFSKTSDDHFILDAMRKNENDPEKTKSYLKTYWAESYEQNYELYKVEDVFAGIYHGAGEDYTEIMRQYEKKIITSGAAELRGCVAVDEQLGQILQILMDDNAFENVETSWRKLCYYYLYVGPEA